MGCIAHFWPSPWRKIWSIKMIDIIPHSWENDWDRETQGKWQPANIRIGLWWQKWDIRLCDPQSQEHLLAFRMLEGLVGKCESLRSVDLMVRLDNIAILLKVNRAVQRSSQHTILSGYKNINIHLGGKPGQSRLSTQFHIVEKMIETEGPEETDSQSISVLDSEDKNETSACVTHSPRNISNSQASLLAFRALEDFVEKRESLRSVDLMVKLDNITILHKMNRAI